MMKFPTLPGSKMNPKKPLNRLSATLIAVAINNLFLGDVWAASDAARIAELESRLGQSLKQLEVLSSRLESLEKSGTAAAAPVPSAETAAADKRIEALERNLVQMSETAARPPANQGVPLHGFADVGYASSGKKSENHKHGFNLGNVDFYLTPVFGDHVKALVELNFEWGLDGSLTTDTERIQLGYTFSDALTLWGGRFHTPYGYYNTAFHHGAQIETSIKRPKMVAFEDRGGILPAHIVGAWATGQTRLADGKVEYDVYAGNGGRIFDNVLDFNAFKDDNSNKLFGGSLRYRFGGALDGLLLGVHGFSEKVSSFTGPTLDSMTQVNMAGAYAFYDANDWEALAEYYRFRDKDVTGDTGTHNSWAGFLQVGKMFRGNIIPYARYEKALLNQADNYFLSQLSGRSYVRQVLGVRYDLNPKTAIKFEVNHTNESRDGGEKYNEALFQVSVRF